MIKSKQIIISGLLVCLFSVTGTVIVSITEHQTHERIEENERQALLRNLYALIPKQRFDNDLAEDTITLEPSELLGNTEKEVAYRARKEDKPVAIIFNSTAHDGYSGDINLLVAVNIDGTIAAVRAIHHKETPGLGDGIEIKKSNWITQFDLKSLLNPDTDEQWAVKRDAGIFDQMTGATITPRAIVAAVNRTLKYFAKNQSVLFKEIEDDDDEDDHDDD